MVGPLAFSRTLGALTVALTLAACATGASSTQNPPRASHGEPPEAPDEAPVANAADETKISLGSSDPDAVAATRAPASAPTTPIVGDDGKARIWAVQLFAKVMQLPDPKSPMIGMIRAGQGVPLTTGKKLDKPGMGPCKNGWYEVAPRGVVCLNDFTTLDPKDPRVGIAKLALPDPAQDLPFAVGTSIGAPMYARIPTRAEQEANEPGLAAHLARALPADDAQGGAIDRKPAGSPPPKELLRYMRESKPRLLADEAAYTGRRMAWTREFDAEGRTWLLTADVGLVPKDKVRTKGWSALAGVDLKAAGAPQLPMAYTWLGEAKKFRRDPSGVLTDTGEVWPRQTFFELTKQSSKGPGGVYWKTKDDLYVRNDLVSVIKPREGGRPQGVKKNDKWIHVRVTWGWLVAYEGDMPVYATAISPGMDGVTERPQGHTTRRGIYPVGWKLLSADMNGVDKGKEWAVDEVPFVGYYKASYAVHGAYWHDDFGLPKSHGCVNMAPRDARWLFNWMDPGLPEGWYAVAAAPGMGVPFTWIDVRP